jgi:hypothetical protein
MQNTSSRTHVWRIVFLGALFVLPDAAAVRSQQKPAATAAVDRTVLPIQEPKRPTYTQSPFRRKIPTRESSA